MAHSLVPHTVDSRSAAVAAQPALAMVPAGRLTHWVTNVVLPDAVCLLRVTGPALLAGERLDRLLLTSVHVPRAARVRALAHPEVLGRAARAARGKLALAGVDAADDLDLQVILDLQDFTTALDAAASLVFHHPELMTLQSEAAATILSYVNSAEGIGDLAQSMLTQSQANEADPSQSNWASLVAATAWDANDQDSPPSRYQWSDLTLSYVTQPLQDALEQTKADVSLQFQCWTVQEGVTTVASPQSSPLDLAPRPSTVHALGDPGPRLTLTVKQLTPEGGLEHSVSWDNDTQQLTISVKNHYLRWLVVNLDQYGADGEGVGVRPAGQLLSPVDTIMAIPLPADWTDFTYSLDPDASSAVLSLGSLGQGPFSIQDDLEGIILTSVFNLAIPTLFIVLGVAADQAGSTWSQVTKDAAADVLLFADAGAQGPLSSLVAQSMSLSDVMVQLANLVGSMLVSLLASSTQLKTYIAALVTESALEDAEPFIGWVALAIGAAADAAEIIETSVEVARSPATVRLDVVMTMDLNVSVNPDPSDGSWPETATSYSVTVTYDDGPTFTTDGPLPSTSSQAPVVVDLPGLPAGGYLSVLFTCHAATGWLAGHGLVSGISARPAAGNVVGVSLAITEELVPLNAETTYAVKEHLEVIDGVREWVADELLPVSTVDDLDESNVGVHLSGVGGIDIDVVNHLVGYAWQASGQDVPIAGGGTTSGQVHAYQTVGATGSPQTGYVRGACGYAGRPAVAFPPLTAAVPMASAYLLEPDVADGDFQLRSVSVGSGGVLTPSTTSFGRFVGAQDDLAIHPSGYAVTLCAGTAKLQVVRLADAGMPDASAPVAAIYAGRGTRSGLLDAPVALACSLDAVIVLTQATQSQPSGGLCAFDIKGNPVSCFAGSVAMTPLRDEQSDVTMVDLCVEARGYIYVAKFLGDANADVTADAYRLDIYTPDGTFLSQSSGLVAASLAVDAWRNVYATGYGLLPPGLPEPGLELWVPSTPTEG